MNICFNGSRSINLNELVNYPACDRIIAGIIAIIRVEISEGNDVAFISGEASGADELNKFLYDLLREQKDIREHVGFMGFPANWTEGRSAGPRRNRRMLDEGKPDVVYSFIDKPLAVSKGTLDFYKAAKQRGIPVVIVDLQGTPLDEATKTDKSHDQVVEEITRHRSKVVRKRRKKSYAPKPGK